MKLVFLNPTHPDVAHVSGMRVPWLGRELARRGHQVLLLTGTLSENDPASLTPAGLEQAIARHDFSAPLHVAVPPRPDAWLRAVRDGSLPASARRAITFYYQLRHFGVFEDWVAGCEPYVAALARAWAPDLVWGTFGGTGSLKIAQRIARRTRAPWLIDFKDSWTFFIHPWLRRYLARRFRDASAATANAEFTRLVAGEWFAPLETSVIYSGVADAFFEGGSPGAAAPARDLLLIGGIYSESRLREFLMALEAWLRASPPAVRESVRLSYLGTNEASVRRVVGAVELSCAVEVHPFVEVAEMARRCRDALACCYIKYDATFHHKLLELLVAGRPVICYPAETPESLALARSFRTPMLSCESPAALEQAFARAWQQRGEPRAVSARSPWSWAARAAELESVFEAVLARRGDAREGRSAARQGSHTLAGRDPSLPSQR